eukprot:4032087-Alexandrium_andersonii.AAC.1
MPIARVASPTPPEHADSPWAARATAQRTMQCSCTASKCITIAQCPARTKDPIGLQGPLSSPAQGLSAAQCH